MPVQKNYKKNYCIIIIIIIIIILKVVMNFMKLIGWVGLERRKLKETTDFVSYLK